MANSEKEEIGEAICRKKNQKRLSSALVVKENFQLSIEVCRIMNALAVK